MTLYGAQHSVYYSIDNVFVVIIFVYRTFIVRALMVYRWYEYGISYNVNNLPFTIYHVRGVNFPHVKVVCARKCRRTVKLFKLYTRDLISNQNTYINFAY